MAAFTQQEMNGTERELLETRSQLRTARLEQATQQADEKKAPELTVPVALLDEQIDKEPGLQLFLQESLRLQSLIDETTKKSARGETDPTLQRYRERLTVEQKAMDAFRQKRRPEYVRKLQEKAKADLIQSAAALKARISFLEERERNLSQDIERLRDKLQEMTKNSIKLEAFREDLSQLEAITKRITFEEEALKVELQAPSRVRLLEEAVLEHSDNRKRLVTTMGLASAGTMGLVLLGFAWWEFRSRRISSPDEVAHGLGIKVVGAIPDSSSPSWLRSWRHNRDLEDLLTESIDATRIMLLEAARGGSLRAVLITSAQPGEGKTSMATRLAVSLALIGHKTLLIDGDLRNPMAHRVLNVQNGRGLCELLRGELDVTEAVQPTSVPALSMLCAGQWDSRATQALPQERAAAVFQRLRATFDFILIDSSPLLPIVDPLLLSKHADGALLSILCNVSRLGNVYAAYQRLTALGVPTLGAVVSGVRDEVYNASYHKYFAQSTN
jgi:capsular exopolysaccharide synthesis family protein